MTADPRTPEQLRRHSEAERELADRLRHSSREERQTLYAEVYKELFARAPDHPRRQARQSPEDIAAAVRARMKLLTGQLDGVSSFLELGAGDCQLALEVCKHVEQVFAADICDQTRPGEALPPNFKLIIYDGFDLPLAAGSIDLAFSYQLIEHLHPDDVDGHFETVKRVLRPGGRYIFATPHRYSGPHDVSRHFTATAQGFHLQEWTCREMIARLKRHGFRRWHCYCKGKPRRSPLIAMGLLLGERLLAALPRGLQRRLSHRLYQSVTMIAIK